MSPFRIKRSVCLVSSGQPTHSSYICLDAFPVIWSTLYPFLKSSSRPLLGQPKLETRNSRCRVELHIVELIDHEESAIVPPHSNPKERPSRYISSTRSHSQWVRLDVLAWNVEAPQTPSAPSGPKAPCGPSAWNHSIIPFHKISEKERWHRLR